MMGDQISEHYVQEIIRVSKKYMEHDEILLRRVIRQLLDQYVLKREEQKQEQ